MPGKHPVLGALQTISQVSVMIPATFRLHLTDEKKRPRKLESLAQGHKPIRSRVATERTFQCPAALLSSAQDDPSGIRDQELSR